MTRTLACSLTLSRWPHWLNQAVFWPVDTFRVPVFALWMAGENPGAACAARFLVNVGLPSPAAERAGACSVKAEGQLVLGSSQASAHPVRSRAGSHALAPASSPACMLADQDVLRPPTMFAHGWAFRVRRETARHSARSERADAPFGAATGGREAKGAGDGGDQPIRFGSSSFAPDVRLPPGAGAGGPGGLLSLARRAAALRRTS